MRDACCMHHTCIGMYLAEQVHLSHLRHHGHLWQYNAKANHWQHLCDQWLSSDGCAVLAAMAVQDDCTTQTNHQELCNL